MKKAEKSALYSTIKSTIEKLGISAENTTGIINYIKFMESSVPSESVTEVSTRKESYPKTSKEINTSESTVLAVMNKNTEKPYSVQEIMDETGFGYFKVRTLLKNLKSSRKVKTVGYEASSGGPSKLLYQIWRSPIKALQIVTEKQGYSTISGFVKNNKKLIIKGVGVTSFAPAVEEAGLTSYPLSLGIGIAKGYKNADLMNVALGNNISTSTKKETKKVAKSKKKSSKAQSVEPSVIEVKPEEQVVTKTSSKLGFIGKFFKKNNTSELIKF